MNLFLAPLRFYLRRVFAVACLLSLSAMAATVDVNMRDNSFSPRNQTVNVGDTVRWRNQGGNDHTTTSSSSPRVWQSPFLQPGGTFPFKFNNAGTFPYFCIPHQSLDMTGTITVSGTANTPPTVTIAQPANGATFPVPASFVFEATAADSDGTVSQVEFFSNGELARTDTASPFRFTLNLPSAGSYTLTAKATDNSGASTVSAPITVTVAAPNSAPQVSITSPANNATFSASANLLLEATASDADGSVARVDFLTGTTLLGSDTVAPYSLTVSNLAAANYSLTAQAVDNMGASSTSAVVNISISAPSAVSLTAASFTANGEFQLTLNGLAAGKTNFIQVSSNLLDWVTVRTNIASGGQLNFIDAASPGLSARFYRVLQSP